MTLFLTKNVVEVYRVLFKDHVSYRAELGQGVIDDILVGTIMVFFLTLFCASVKFNVDSVGT